VADIASTAKTLSRVVDEVMRAFVGPRRVVELAVATMVSEGHILVEGPPGTGKTLLAKSLALSVSGSYKRVQGHVDIMPSDITGFHIYTVDGRARFVEGPIFANVVLVDELNRISPRSQASILEAMQEKQVTVDGVTYKLPRPNFIIATQVPTDEPGSVYGIISTLRDRFTASVVLDYASHDGEVEIIERSDATWGRDPPVEAVASTDDLLAYRGVAAGVHVSRSVASYIVRLVEELRRSPAVAYGPSHRVTVDLYRLSKVWALMDSRDYVIPDDVKSLLAPVARHRIRLAREAEAAGATPESVIEEVLESVPVPRG